MAFSHICGSTGSTILKYSIIFPSTSRISQFQIAKFATYHYNIVLYFLFVSRLRYIYDMPPTQTLHQPGELSMPPSDKATFSNISKQFSKTIIFCRIGLFSATLIRSNSVVLRSSSFDDDKQSTFFRLKSVQDFLVQSVVRKVSTGGGIRSNSTLCLWERCCCLSKSCL